MIMNTQMNYFSTSYTESRQRFCSALGLANFTHYTYPIRAKGPHGEQLTIDVGIRRAESSDRTLFVTSGLHGVEGYFGAAVQLQALLDPAFLKMAAQYTIVFVHALNPYGYAWNRRANENNVDLNRSFFNPSEKRAETLGAFERFVPLLAPETPPLPLELDTFPAELTALIEQYGLPYLKQTLAVGQYDHEQCLFYGGASASETQTILSVHLAEWVGNADHIVLLDFHTGLGERGTYKLLAPRNSNEAELARLHSMFGDDRIETAAIYTAAEGGGVSYDARGTFPVWFKNQLPERKCYAATAEFGTENEIRVLQSLVAENRAFFHGDRTGEDAWTVKQLIEMFAPADRSWRTQVLACAQITLQQALG